MAHRSKQLSLFFWGVMAGAALTATLFALHNQSNVWLPTPEWRHLDERNRVLTQLENLLGQPITEATLADLEAKGKTQ